MKSNADLRLEIATATPSHDGGHTMELRSQVDAPTLRPYVWCVGTA